MHSFSPSLPFIGAEVGTRGSLDAPYNVFLFIAIQLRIRVFIAREQQENTITGNPPCYVEGQEKFKGIPPEENRRFLRVVVMHNACGHYTYYRHGSKASFSLSDVGINFARLFLGHYEFEHELKQQVAPYGPSSGCTFMVAKEDGLENNGTSIAKEVERNEESKQAAGPTTAEKEQDQQGVDNPDKEDKQNDDENSEHVGETCKENDALTHHFLKAFVEARRCKQERASELEASLREYSSQNDIGLEVCVQQWYKYMCRRTQDDVDSTATFISNSSYPPRPPLPRPPLPEPVLNQAVDLNNCFDINIPGSDGISSDESELERFKGFEGDTTMSALGVSLLLGEEITGEFPCFPFCTSSSFVQPQFVQNRPMDIVKLKRLPLLNENVRLKQGLIETRQLLRHSKISLVPYVPVEATCADNCTSKITSCLSPFDSKADPPFVGCLPEPDCLDNLLTMLGDGSFVDQQKQLASSHPKWPAYRLCQSIYRFFRLLRVCYGSLATVGDWVAFHGTLRSKMQGEFPFLPEPQTFNDLNWQSKLFVNKATWLRFSVPDGQKRLQHVVSVLLNLTLGIFNEEVPSKNIPNKQYIDQILEVFSISISPDVYVPMSLGKASLKVFSRSLAKSLLDLSAEIQKVCDETGIITVADR